MYESERMIARRDHGWYPQVSTDMVDGTQRTVVHETYMCARHIQGSADCMFVKHKT